MRCVLGCIILWSLASPSVLAHDLWLVPPTGRPVTDKVVAVQAISGMKFPVADGVPDPAKFARRWGRTPSGKVFEVEAAGKSKDGGLLRFTPTEPGCHVLAVQTTPRILEMAAVDFNRYLVADGLPHVYLQRDEERQLDRPARERYSKSPKALVRVGDGAQGDATRPLGLPLEIVPLESPFAKKPGEALRVQVLFQGKPLPEANLGWDYAGPESSPRGTARANAEGIALVPLEKPGLLVVRLTHMTRPKHQDYEWESFWTSLVFEVTGKD